MCVSKKLLFFLLLCSPSVFGQVVNISDTIFKAYLVGDTLINTNRDGEIQVGEASAFTDAIDVKSLGISDLTGIEAFTAITYLDCSSNSLTGLHVTNNTALTDLYCAGNSLTSLNVSKNTALTWLYCADNSLTGLHVTNNTALTFLRCYNNSLTDLDVSKNTALTKLHCAGNSLTSLDVSGATALIYLHCANNSLTGLDVSKNTALTDLRCGGNSLTGLDVRNGNNGNFWYFNAINNPNLTCISVDDASWSNANWSSDKDSLTVYSNDCITVGTKDN